MDVGSSVIDTEDAKRVLKFLTIRMKKKRNAKKKMKRRHIFYCF